MRHSRVPMIRVDDVTHTRSAILPCRIVAFWLCHTIGSNCYCAKHWSPAPNHHPHPASHGLLETDPFHRAPAILCNCMSVLFMVRVLGIILERTPHTQTAQLQKVGRNSQCRWSLYHTQHDYIEWFVSHTGVAAQLLRSTDLCVRSLTMCIS